MQWPTHSISSHIPHALELVLEKIYERGYQEQGGHHTRNTGVQHEQQEELQGHVRAEMINTAG